MPIIKSFKGVFFNNKKVKLEDVVTPPYDVISQEQQEEFYNRSPYNIVRLILGKEFEDDNDANNRYTRASEFLTKWFNEGILVKDNEESIYYLEEEFYVDSVKKLRKGFIALAKLEDFSKGNILPHEKTMHGPKADRLNLTKACKCNFSQIFSVYSDEHSSTLNLLAESLNSKAPFLSLGFEKKKYSLWKVNDINTITKLHSCMLHKKIFIADGHHRYETALAYRDYMRKKYNITDDEQPFDYVMMYFSPIENNDLLILPTHRGVKDIDFNAETLIDSLKEYFEIKEYKKIELNKVLQELKMFENDYTIFGFYSGEKNIYILKFKNNIKDTLNDIESLDVQILQNYILEKHLNITQADLDNKTKIEYIKDIEYGIKLVENGNLKGLFILNPTKIEQVKKIALSGRKMPQKSTYFYPKLITGLVIYKIE